MHGVFRKEELQDPGKTVNAKSVENKQPWKPG